MSFTSTGGGGAAEEVLSYMIRAHDMATPVFKAFGGQVAATTREVQASLAAMQRSLAAHAVEMQRLGKAQRDAVAGGAAFSRSAAATEAASGTMARGVGRGTNEIVRHENAIKEAGYALSGFSGQLGPLGRSLDLSARHAQLFREKGIDYLAAGLTGLSAATVIFGVKQAAAFDTMAKKMEQQAGVTSGVAKQLVADVQEVAQKSPAAWDQISQAVAAQHQLFGDNAKAIKENTDLFLAFADRAQGQVAPTITALSNVMRQFHPAGMSVVDVMDQLVNLSQHTQQPLQQYMSILNKFGPALQAMGLNFPQIIGLFQSFSAHGITATQMGRGLASALANAEKQIKAAQSATQDGGIKLLEYRDAVDSAQIRVNTLNTQLKEHKGNQQKVNDELVVAQNHLSIAKQKYDILTGSLKNASKAHESVAKVVGDELKAIETAKTPQDALNQAIHAFGTRLGPQMASALYHNRGALDAMQKSLGSAHGATEKLAEAQRSSLHGQLQILKHDFEEIAANVGQTAMPVLKDMAGVFTDIAKAVHGIPKPVLDALVFGGGGLGAATLILRHTPLGGLAARAMGDKAPGWLRTFLTAKSPTGSAIAGAEGSAAGGASVFGVTGTNIRAGSRFNPVAVVDIGGGGGGSNLIKDAEKGGGGGLVSQFIAKTFGKGIPTAVEEGAPVGAEAAAGGLALPVVTAIALPVAMAALAIFDRKNFPTGGNQGQPEWTHNTTQEIFGSGQVARNLRVFGGGTGADAGLGQFNKGAALGATSAGAQPGHFGQVLPFKNSNLKEFQLDAERASMALGSLSQHNITINQTIGVLNRLAHQAGQLGDTKMQFGDKLGAEMLKSKGTISKGVADLLKQVDKLPPGLRSRAEDGMVQMAHALHDKGQLSQVQMDNLLTYLDTHTKAAMAHVQAQVSNAFGDVFGAVSGNSKHAKDVGSKNISDLAKSIGDSVTRAKTAATTQTDHMHKNVASNTDKTHQEGASNIEKLAGNIAGFFGGAAGATHTGIGNIGDQVSKALESLGGGKFSIAKVDAVSAGKLAGQAVSGVFGHAGGGYVGHPGERGRDEIDIRVGRGEAILNHPQQGWVNTALATSPVTRSKGITGLHSLFSRETTPHYMASGGFAGGGIAFSAPVSTFGPPGDPPGSTASGNAGGDTVPGLSLRIPGTTYADARNRALMGHKFRLDLQGHSGIFPDIDLGPADWTGVNIDVTGAASRAMGIDPSQFPTRSIGTVTEVDAGAVVTVGGTAGLAATIPQIKLPKVTGGGQMGKATKAALKKVVEAANKYVIAHAPKSAVGGGPGGYSTFAGPGNFSMYRWPVPDGAPFNPGRIDRGQDFETSPHGTFNAIGDAVITSGATDFPGVTYRLLAGPAAGKQVFDGHTYQSFVSPGQQVKAGQPIGLVGHQGESYDGGVTHLELGFLTDQGQVAPAENSQHYSYTGQEMHDLLEHIRPFFQGGFAGAFGDGGGFTAHRPTFGLFGEKGAEDVIAIPHAQSGLAGDVTAGTYPTPSKPHHHKHSAGSKMSPGRNPFTDKVETHSSDDWKLIHAEWAKAQHDAQAAKKAFDAYMAQQVTDTLKIGGMKVGDLQESRKKFGSENLPLGGGFQLFGKGIDRLTDKGFTQVGSAVQKQLNLNTLEQTLKEAAKGMHGLTHGVEHPVFRQIGGLQSHLAKLNEKADKLREQEKDLREKAKSETGFRWVRTEIHLGNIRTELKDIGKHSAAIRGHLVKLGDKLTGSRAGQLEDRIIGAALKGLTSAIANTEKDFQQKSDIYSLIQGLYPGTSAKSVGIGPAQLKSLGVTGAQFKKLAGGEDPASFSTLIHNLLDKEIAEYKHRAAQLAKLYKEALKMHDKKRADAILKELNQTTQDELKARTDYQQTKVKQVDAVFQKVADKNTGLQASADLEKGIVAMPTGTNLASVGLTNKVLLRMGINPTTAQSLVGNANPMGAAQLMNSDLSAQRANAASALKQLTGMLPGLHGKAYDEAETKIKDLSGTIATLTTQMNTNFLDAIKAVESKFEDLAAVGSVQGTDITGIANLAAGTDLGSLGLTPGVLATMGIDPATAAAVMGGGPNAINREKNAQGGTLTPGQVAAATSYYGALNTSDQGQINAYKGELGSDYSMLPQLTGQDRVDMVKHIGELIQKITGLSDDMQNNTDAVTALTSATNQNTTATGQMTGTVAYAYNGQQYTASLSSDQNVNLPVGA